jgi:hypothetical protein
MNEHYIRPEIQSFATQMEFFLRQNEMCWGKESVKYLMQRLKERYEKILQDPGDKQNIANMANILMMLFIQVQFDDSLPYYVDYKEEL